MLSQISIEEINYPLMHRKDAKKGKEFYPPRVMLTIKQVGESDKPFYFPLKVSGLDRDISCNISLSPCENMRLQSSVSACFIVVFVFLLMHLFCFSDSFLL